MIPAVNHEKIEMVPVESSNLKAVGYDEANKVLKVEFLNGGTYIYTDVEPYHFKNITTNVKSVGRYFIENIRNNADKYQSFNVTEKK